MYPFSPGERVRFASVLAHPFPGRVPGYGERGIILEAPPPGWISGQDPRFDHVLVGWDYSGVIPSLVGNINYVWRG